MYPPICDLYCAVIHTHARFPSFGKKCVKSRFSKTFLSLFKKIMLPLKQIMGLKKVDQLVEKGSLETDVAGKS
jgi:hypothetical protein